MYQADVCDSPFLQYLFDRYSFTDVVHLAAQAGVRHSLEAPLAYVHTNLHCFLTLLEVLKERKVKWTPLLEQGLTGRKSGVCLITL